MWPWPQGSSLLLADRHGHEDVGQQMQVSPDRDRARALGDLEGGPCLLWTRRLGEVGQKVGGGV